MISEAIDRVVTLAVQGNNPSIINVDPSDPSKAHVWLPSIEHLLPVDKTIPPRMHTVLTVDSFAESVERYAEDVPGAAVWVTTGQVVLVLNDNGFRHSRVTLPVQPSPIFASLKRLNGVKFDQKALLKFLKHDLQSAALPDSFTLAIASLKWETNDTETGGVSTTKNAMGRAINAEVKGEAGDLPESFTLTFNPFPAISGYQTRVEVTCSVFFDPVEREIEVLPQPGSLDLATAKALEDLARFIEEAMHEGPTVFCGTP